MNSLSYKISNSISKFPIKFQKSSLKVKFKSQVQKAARSFCAILHHPTPITHHPTPIILHPTPITHPPSSNTHHPTPITHPPSSNTHHPPSLT
jgi:hypothetical protein